MILMKGGLSISGIQITPLTLFLLPLHSLSDVSF
jgi:hypothetical protein